MTHSVSDAAPTLLSHDLIVQKGGESAALRACYGEVTTLNFTHGLNPWEFVQSVLVPESNWRTRLLNGIESLEKAPSQAGWSLQNFRRTIAISFCPSSEASSVFTFLELSLPLHEQVAIHSHRECPHCGTALLEIGRDALETLIFETFEKEDIAIAIPYVAERASNELPLVLTKGQILDLSTLKHATIDATIIDRCTVNETNRNRIADALRIAWQKYPNKLLLFRRTERGYEELRAFTISDSCQDCGFIAPPISPTLFRDLTRDSALTEKVGASVRIGEGTLATILQNPLASLELKDSKGILPFVKDFARNLLTPTISLESLISEISPPLRQRLHILKHLIRETKDSILVFEEPFSLSMEDTSNLKEYLQLLAKPRNAVLVIDTSDKPDMMRLNEQASHTATVLTASLLTPGACLVYHARDGDEVDSALAQIISSSIEKSAVLVKLPPLTSISAGTKTAAESVELLDPLVEFYQTLPTAIAHNLRREQLLGALPPTIAPRFKGVSLPDVLRLTISGAFELLAHIPSCAKILQRLSELGLGDVPLSHPVASLSLGQRQLMRLSHLNCRPAKRRRIYHIEHPFAGLDTAMLKHAESVMGALLQAGHTLMLTTHDVPSLPFEVVAIRLQSKG